MALRLLGQDERTTVKVGGTSFRIRKIPHAISVALTRAHTRKGRVDEIGLERALWLYLLVGWDDLFDAKGEALPFSTERVPWPDPMTGDPVKDPETGEPRTEPLPYVVAMGLPQTIAELLVAEARGAEVKVHEALGNFAPSSRSA